MIFYFSATGNSKYVAECIAKATGDKACSITEYTNNHDNLYRLSNNENFGIVSPTYYWELPTIMKEFLEKIVIENIDNNYIFSALTYGTTPGASGACVKHILKKKGVKVDALYSIIMPDTWTPIFDLSNVDKVDKRNKIAEEQLQGVIAKVSDKCKGNFMNRSAPYFVTKFSDRMYQNMRKTSHFHVEDTCIGCGLCEKKCPINAIGMKDNKPYWKEDKCVMCLGCLHRCPKFSIQYGDKTKKHGQYINPNVRT